MKQIARLTLFVVILILQQSPLTAQKGEEISFSHSRGYYESAFDLQLSPTTPNASLHFTLDGSTPTRNTQRYTGPISITNSSIVKAKAYLGKDSSKIISHTYLFIPSILAQEDSIPGWPLPDKMIDYKFKTVKLDYGMDPEIIGVEADKQEIIKGFSEIPTLALGMSKDSFWKMTHGSDEFPASVEIIYPNEPSQSEYIYAGIEGVSHKHLKRNYRLSFKKKYGKGTFKSSVLQEYAPLNGENATNKFDRLVLRAGTQRSWTRNWLPNKTAFTRDQWYRDTQIAMNGIGPHGTFVHLFINGIYWGIYNLCERPDEKFTAAYLPGKDKDWYAFNHNGDLSGDNTRYEYLMDELLGKDMSLEENYSELEAYLDIPLFCDYLILCWYIGMVDWPENNFYGGNYAKKNGPIRFFAWDGELSWDDEMDGSPGAWVHYEFEKEEEGESPISYLWHAARKNPKFLRTFADRVNTHCFHNGALSEHRNIQRWQEVNAFIRSSVVAESARWGDALKDSTTRTRAGHWEPEVQRVMGLMKGNSERFVNVLREQGYYPSIDPPKLVFEKGKLRLAEKPIREVEVYFTTDGSDPCSSDGKIAPNATVLEKKAKFEGAPEIKARSKKGNEWSALWME